MRNWAPPKAWRRITTLESHAAGEPLRIVTGGIDPIPGATILEKRRYAREHLDGLRRAIVFEPRGHADMYGAIPTEPVTPDGDLGVLFLHNEGWSTMCGHGIVALTTALLETGERSGDVVRYDAPPGRVTARATRDGARVREVVFENVPSFAVALDETVQVEGLGEVRYDLAFGGAFYAFVDADALGIALDASGFRRCIDVGMRIKRAVMSAREVRHPESPDAADLSFLYGTILTGKAHGVGADSRNVCVFAEGEVDRSPTGTGVSARVAIERARGRLREGAWFTVESIIGTRFRGRALRATTVGPYDAVVPEVAGSAWLTGRSELWIAPDDPLPEGFVLR
ncbi:MAG TPA: proline racemase family protein [Candidatus Limnocylindria bacterium]|nr:proline racemase family protein [Candidatus Limnocylindria bacterium]